MRPRSLKQVKVSHLAKPPCCTTCGGPEWLVPKSSLVGEGEANRNQKALVGRKLEQFGIKIIKCSRRREILGWTDGHLALCPVLSSWTLCRPPDPPLSLPARTGWLLKSLCVCVWSVVTFFLSGRLSFNNKWPKCWHTIRDMLNFHNS